MTPSTWQHLWAAAHHPDAYVVSVARDDLAELMDAATKALGFMRALGWHIALDGSVGSEDEALERAAAQEAYDALAKAMGRNA